MISERPAFFSRRIALFMALSWTAMIFILLSIPGSGFPSSSLWQYDKAAHFGLFMILALLWMNVFSGDGPRIVLLVLIGGLTLAPLSEFYQSVLPIGRTADIYDSVADAAGFVTGTLLWMLILRLRTRHRDEK